MEVRKFEIEGPLLLKSKVYHDERGFFTERFKKPQFLELGIRADFIQDNFSRSAAGVLRGMHFQHTPKQSKLVTALRGRVQDVIIDIRKNSPTFGKHISIVLDGNDPHWLWVPAGFAHGFAVLGNETVDMLYKVDALWAAGGEGSINFADPDLNISWELKNPNLSPKDKTAPSWKEYLKNPVF